MQVRTIDEVFAVTERYKTYPRYLEHMLFKDRNLGYYYPCRCVVFVTACGLVGHPVWYIADPNDLVRTSNRRLQAIALATSRERARAGLVTEVLRAKRRRVEASEEQMRTEMMRDVELCDVPTLQLPPMHPDDIPEAHQLQVVCDAPPSRQIEEVENQVQTMVVN